MVCLEIERLKRKNYQKYLQLDDEIYSINEALDILADQTDN